MNLTEFLPKLEGVKKSGRGWVARCPAHDDRKASLSVTLGEGNRILLHCFAGCSVESIVTALDLKVSDLFSMQTKEILNVRQRIVTTYQYTDEAGEVLFECVRYEPKDFSQRRPDPAKPGKWIWNLHGVRRVLYRLPELKAAIAAGNSIYVAAGEKDVGALVEHGFAATCNPLGEKKDGSSWLPEHTETLRGAARVIVIADKDNVGRAHARAVATALRATVPSLKLIELPDRDRKAVKDAADWFAAGGTADELQTIVEAAPDVAPTSGPQPTLPASVASEYLGGDDRSNGQDNDQRPVRESTATRLVRFADEFAFFHDVQNRAFVRLDVHGHTEVWSVNSTQFRNLLAQTFYRRTRTAINRNALADAITTLAGRACFDSPEEPVFLRVAPQGENILIDLCDPQWRVIGVTSTGWSILERSPVAFIRTGAMAALPLPAPPADSSLDPLWKLLNVTPAQRPLVAGALLNYYQPNGPFFVTNFVGEQGTTKSCAARIIRSLIDPNETPLRSPPRTEQDLLVQAASNWCVALDNLSTLPPWLSDGLCRLSTGGGHSARSLYTDAEEFTLSVKRPVILNGIEDVAARPDLAERALQIELEPIAEDRRISERELWTKFGLARPVIFSAILNGLAHASQQLPNVRMASLPRMADCASWATAGETAFEFKPGSFISAYTNNLTDGAIASVESHPVGVAIRQVLDSKPEWSGEPARLLKDLNAVASEDLRHAPSWPKNARALGASLRRLAPALRRVGLDLQFGHGKRRAVRLCRRGDFASLASLATLQPGDADANDAKIQPLDDEMTAQPGKLVEELI